MNETEMLEKILQAISEVADDRATSSWYEGRSDAYRDAAGAVRDIVNEVLRGLNEEMHIVPSEYVKEIEK